MSNCFAYFTILLCPTVSCLFLFRNGESWKKEPVIDVKQSKVSEWKTIVGKQFSIETGEIMENNLIFARASCWLKEGLSLPWSLSVNEVSCLLQKSINYFLSLSSDSPRSPAQAQHLNCIIQLLNFFLTIDNFILLNLRFCFVASILFLAHQRTKKNFHSWVCLREISILISFGYFHEWTNEQDNNRRKRSWNVNCSFFAEFSWSRLIENLMWDAFPFIPDQRCFDLNRKEFLL